MTQADQFDRLLDALPKIAESVNAFTSRAVQKAAFSALVGALGLPAVKFDPEPDTGDRSAGDRDPGLQALDNGSTNVKPPAKTARPRKAPASVTPVKDIDFWPEGSQSLPDFVAEKQPGTKYEQNLVAVYYLEQRLNMSGITTGHVLAAFKASSWPEPTNPANALQQTASTKHWLDTGDMKAIKTTPGGRNMVEHSMPVARKASTSK